MRRTHSQLVYAASVATTYCSRRWTERIRKQLDALEKYFRPIGQIERRLRYPAAGRGYFQAQSTRCCSLTLDRADVFELLSWNRTHPLTGLLRCRSQGGWPYKQKIQQRSRIKQGGRDTFHGGCWWECSLIRRRHSLPLGRKNTSIMNPVFVACRRGPNFTSKGSRNAAVA